MQECNANNIKAVIDEAINGRLCVQTWLGIGQVLFIGFGEEVLPATELGKHHPVPTNELQTGFAYWWVESQSEVVGNSDDEPARALAAASLLVGRRVIGWQFINSSPALEIIFSDSIKLRMAACCNIDVQQDAWILRVPIYYFYMKWDGTFGTGRRDAYFTEDLDDA